MDGRDFYNLAVELSAKDRPEELRSATSRAYYGAFHRVSEYLRSIGISLPTGPECHRKVRWMLDNSGDGDIVVASGKLSTLRTARNGADYDLANVALETKKTVAINLHLARQVMSCIDQCVPGQPKEPVRVALRTYAKSTLGLSVI